MTLDSSRDLIHAAPFTLHLADGRFAPVPHPDFITVTGAGQTAIVAGKTEDHFSIVDLLLLTQLEVGGSLPADS